MKEKQRKKRVEIILLLLFLLWLCLFCVNYVRYTKGASPIIAIKKTRTYEDGTIKEWIGIGYVYRKYNRISIVKEEFVPFWKGIDKTKTSLEIPNTYKDYTVPKNESKARRYKGILYFYNQNRKLIGTYKCINTSVSCDWAGVGIDKDDLINKDPLTSVNEEYVFSILYDSYAFIDDSEEQEAEYNDPLYNKTIYLFSIKENEILARFEDIKPSLYGYSYAEGADYNFIVKDYKTHKWGLIHINEEGKITELLPFVYESISYDKDTSYYILHKEDYFSIYDVTEKKEVVTEVKEPIYDVWMNDNKTLFYKTGIEKVGKVFYSVYRENKEPFFKQDNITEIIAHPKFILYVDETDKKIKFMDYSLAIKDSVQLYFTELFFDKKTNPAFEITQIKKGVYYFKVYKEREKGNSFDYRSVDTNKLFGNTNTL